MKTLTPFQKAVVTVVRLVPYGKVISYGQVATYIGLPRAARQVGWILRGLEESIQIPWWRVINNAGRITIKGNKYNNASIQKQLLEQEGIKINKDFELDIQKYRYRADLKTLQKLHMDKEYIQLVIEKYSL